MGLFNLLGDVASVAVKTALTPVAIAKDVINVATGDEPTATKDLIKSMGDDFEDAADELMP